MKTRLHRAKDFNKASRAYPYVSDGKMLHTRLVLSPRVSLTRLHATRSAHVSSYHRPYRQRAIGAPSSYHRGNSAKIRPEVFQLHHRNADKSFTCLTESESWVLLSCRHRDCVVKMVEMEQHTHTPRLKMWAVSEEIPRLPTPARNLDHCSFRVHLTNLVVPCFFPDLPVSITQRLIILGSSPHLHQELRAVHVLSTRLLRVHLLEFCSTFDTSCF